MAQVSLVESCPPLAAIVAAAGTERRARDVMLKNTPLQMDCFDLLAQLPDQSVNLIFVDPPYNIGVFKKMPPADYLAWCAEWIAEGSRVLAANGAFWVSHKDPEVLVELSRMIAQHSRQRVNWITWDKYNGADKLRGFLDGYTLMGDLRSFQVMAEYLIYHTDEGQWTAQCDKERGFIFEPLRAYLTSEWKRAGFGRVELNQAIGTATTGGGMASHYLGTTMQWKLPTSEHYRMMRDYANRNNSNEYLRREYEDLRREYEDLRYTFNNPGKVSSVWQIPPAPKSKHPTPKPEALLERIISTTSNEGDIVLDFFAGSFTTAAVAERLGRQWICCDVDAQWVELGRARLAQAEQVPMHLEPAL